MGRPPPTRFYVEWLSLAIVKDIEKLSRAIVKVLEKAIAGYSQGDRKGYSGL